MQGVVAALLRKVGLGRRSGLKSSDPPARHAPIRKISAKRRSRFDARRACVRAVLARSGGRCEARVPGICLEHAGRPYPVEVHERRLRSQGGDPTDPANCLAICRGCHDWAHTHRAEARRLGLIWHREDVRRGDAAEGKRGAA